MPTNQVSGVQPVSGAADLSFDLANRVPQLLPFSVEFLLELMNIFVCTHKAPSPSSVRRLTEIPIADHLAVQQRQANGASLVHVPQNAARDIIGSRGILTPNAAVKAQIFQLR
jgi:plasmid maintenance system antidote protein VapI